MNVLMLSAEVAPFSAVGGLSQVIHYLAKSLSKVGHDVRVFSPLYGKVRAKKIGAKVLIPSLLVPSDSTKKHDAAVIECSISMVKKAKPQVYFVDNREYFALRENAYGYGDDHQRFYLLSRSCLEWLLHQKQTKGWFPEIIHCNDWHTGYFIELARTHARYKKMLSHIPIVYSVHNFHYQGNQDFAYLPPKERDNGRGKLASFFDGKKLLGQNALLRGISKADWITTVSPSHAIEVLTPSYGEGLEKTLLRRRGTLSGILNGLDTTMFDPNKDPLIVDNYDQSSLEKRVGNKLVLQKEFGLVQDQNIPLLAYTGRLDKQKGLSLIADVLPQLITELGVQFVILGGGDQQISGEFRSLQQKYPENIGTHLYANFKLPRKIFAGADMLLMPSMFEPGGIVALEALRYGCIPIVRRTGGLADIVRDFDPETGSGYGFSFTGIKPTSLLIAATRAVETYRNSRLWMRVIRNAMRADFSWDASMREYVKLYKKVIALHRRTLQENPDRAFV